MDTSVVQEVKENGPRAHLGPEKFLAGLLICGSQRSNATMYKVVRNLINSNTCSMCGIPVAGLSLPGLTYLKNRVKPVMRSLIAQHEILELTVDTHRAGAKVGVEKYKSKSAVPVLVVKPSEWARVDFSTPAIKKLIWDDENEDKNVFSSI